MLRIVWKGEFSALESIQLRGSGQRLDPRTPWKNDESVLFILGI